MEKTKPKFGIGQEVKITIPRDDFDYKFDGKIGIITDITNLSDQPEYSLEIDGKKIGIHFLEQDLESVKGESK